MIDTILSILSVILGVVAAITWWRNGQSIRKGFGLTFGVAALGDFGAGLLITFLGMAGIFLVTLLLRATQIVGVGFDAGDMLNGILLFTVGAIYEEILFRALLLNGLVVVLGGRKWVAILLSAAVFGVVHLSNPGASPISAFGNALGGIIYGMAFLGGRNLWLPLGLHFSWNFSQGPILGFPVSGFEFLGLIRQETVGSVLVTGGAYGPEAGLVGMFFRFVIMAMVLFYLQRRAHGQGDPKTLEYPIPAYENPKVPR
ncbi:MAG: CPBP family intramembrane metalloprotease [Caldilineaceae bacterium]|nr:CPBP family intramembrane metalloprotease [Caldilineaceae bacterium]MCB0097201.1 CPBP family intramembrane metalloprotease [Caldilineaceae bacterium]MCB0142834.1 CPBP family intramembrane metalloprotease [Caldilineaceae bacterium]